MTYKSHVCQHYMYFYKSPVYLTMQPKALATY